MNKSTIPPPDAAQAADDDVLQQYLQLVTRYKWVVIGTIAIACTATYFHTLRLPKIYQADCTIEYDPSPARPLGRDIEDVAAPFNFWNSNEYFQTQNRIIASRSVAERVVVRLGLHQDPEFLGVPKEARKGWKGISQGAAARALQGRISVVQDRDSRIVHIRATDRKPERAQLLANAVADAYIEKTLQDRLGSTTNALDWLGQQLEGLKNELEGSELALHEFTEQHSDLTLPLDEQKEVLALTIQQISEQLTSTRTQRIAKAAQLKELRAANREDPLAVHADAIISNQTIANLRAKHFAAAAERGALAVELGEAHPKMRAIDAAMEPLRAQIREEIDAVIDSAESNLREIRAIEAGLADALADANETGLRLNLKEITFRRLERTRNNTAKLYGTILERTTETDLTQALEVSFVRIVDRATRPHFAISPRMRSNLLVGGVGGVAVAALLALLLMRLDRTIRTVADAESLGATVLGIMPRIDDGASLSVPPYARRQRRHRPELVTNRDLIVHTHPKSPVAECCRTIRTNLMFMATDQALRTITVTSANPREGKTTVALSLAIALAQSGKRVLVVDTDLRKPRLHRALGITASRGATSILVGQHTIEEAVQETEIPNLWGLASGPIPPNPSELLHTAQFGELVENLRKQFDTVIFDSSPLGAVTDAAIISRRVDGTVIVIQSQQTTRDALQNSLRQLRDVRANILGAVLNDVDLSERRHGTGSYYYYHSDGYYAASAEEEEATREVPAAES